MTGHRTPKPTLAGELAALADDELAQSRAEAALWRRAARHGFYCVPIGRAGRAAYALHDPGRGVSFDGDLGEVLAFLRTQRRLW